ncbi:hypothetical protein GCM10009799_29240 [Nocardiopsis rhodophaea]|uniref:Uncharacterized protein n=1 Tax=Nocardiopsis rhodophaea TaxID=280238 RepID=A0ABN2T789_9ACTN
MVAPTTATTGDDGRHGRLRLAKRFEIVDGGLAEPIVHTQHLSPARWGRGLLAAHPVAVAVKV